MAKSLSERMLEAAATLKEASKVYDYMVPDKAEWSPERLRLEAKHVAADEEAEAPGRDLTIYAEVRAAVETTVRVPEGFDVNDKRAVEDLWFAEHDYTRDIADIHEIDVDHDHTVSLDEFE